MGKFLKIGWRADATIKLERSLRQGDIPSILLFAYGLDPYLERLRDKLEGIVIFLEEIISILPGFLSL